MYPKSRDPSRNTLQLFKKDLATFLLGIAVVDDGKLYGIEPNRVAFKCERYNGVEILFAATAYRLGVREKEKRNTQAHKYTHTHMHYSRTYSTSE